MTRRRWMPRRIALACLTGTTSAAGAQGLTSISSPTLTVVTPTESHYDAGASSPTPTYSITTSCVGATGPGCRLFIEYSTSGQGQPMDLQYAIVSLNADCNGAAAAPDTWYAVDGSTQVLRTARNASCVATFRFRVSPLAWNVYTAPGPSGGAYWQRVNLVLTRP